MIVRTEYRGCCIYTDIDYVIGENTPTFIAYIHDNGTCYGEELSYVSEEKAIQKAKKFIDVLLEETE